MNSKRSLLNEIVASVAKLKRFDLSQSTHVGIPHFPTHPPYTRSLTKLHGDVVLPNGASSAADAISLGTHTGTHIDALCHYSSHGHFYGGEAAAAVQDWAKGISRHGVETAPLFLCRGVLLDVARLADACGGPLAAHARIGAEDLARAEEASGVRVEAGGVALIRTGWGHYWNDPRSFLNGLHLPGVTLDGARWLSDRGVVAAGSDTVAFEAMPSPLMEVHVHLLVQSGIHIMECLNLEVLSDANVHEFLFIATALKLDGATGSPIRPYALAV
jgi:kynurenine formamidase